MASTFEEAQARLVELQQLEQAAWLLWVEDDESIDESIHYRAYREYHYQVKGFEECLKMLRGEAE